jgi:hypothetical protein
MFHFKNESTSLSDFKQKIQATFERFSSDREHRLLFKTDFKCAWLYLFGYKISKVFIFVEYNLLVFQRKFMTFANF